MSIIYLSLPYACPIATYFPRKSAISTFLELKGIYCKSLLKRRLDFQRKILFPEISQKLLFLFIVLNINLLKDIEPIYGLTSGLSHRILSKYIEKILENLHVFDEWIDKKLNPPPWTYGQKFFELDSWC